MSILKDLCAGGGQTVYLQILKKNNRVWFLLIILLSFYSCNSSKNEQMNEYSLSNEFKLIILNKEAINQVLEIDSNFIKGNFEPFLNIVSEMLKQLQVIKESKHQSHSIFCIEDTTFQRNHDVVLQSAINTLTNFCSSKNPSNEKHLLYVYLLIMTYNTREIYGDDWYLIEDIRFSYGFIREYINSFVDCFNDRNKKYFTYENIIFPSIGEYWEINYWRVDNNYFSNFSSSIKTDAKYYQDVLKVFLIKFYLESSNEYVLYVDDNS